MRIMKSKSFFESFQENLKENDKLNESNINLKESDNIVWSSDYSDSFRNWSDEDFIEEYKNQTGEEPVDVEEAKDWFLNDTDEAVFDAMKDNLDYIVENVIDPQTTDDVIFLSGTVGVWTGNHPGGKTVELSSADDLLNVSEVDDVKLINENGNLVYEGSHHDGTHVMGLYGLPKDENKRIELVKELGIVDWYKDMYSYDNPDEDALNDALNDLYSANRLNDILTPEDYVKIAKICPPIKAKGGLNESELQPKYSDRKSFYGKANVDKDNVLTSYKTKIMRIKDGKVEMLCDEDALTQTTLRHIREFLQQNGLEPLSKKELIKLINEKEKVNEAVDKETGKEILLGNDESSESGVETSENNDVKHYYITLKHDDGKIKVHTTASSKEQAIKQVCDMEKAPQSAVIDVKEKELVNEHDSVIKVFKPIDSERNYSIVDITELSEITEGDVQPPIDVAGLLTEVDSRLTESFGDWGTINIQSTRCNKDTKESNALFELNVGKNTYLLSMLLENNCSTLKVNNTNGKTIFKRKSNDVIGLAESYIKQFIPKEEKEVPECLKHINQPLHARLDFIKLYIDIYKSAPKEEKDNFKEYIEKEIYAFVAEVSDEIKVNEPNNEDKLELPSFDKMVKEIFGKEWVKENKEESKQYKVSDERESIKLKENNVFTSFRSNGQDEGLIGRLYVDVNDKSEAFDLFKDDGKYKLIYGTIIPDYIKEFVDSVGGYDKFLQDAVDYVNSESLNEESKEIEGAETLKESFFVKIWNDATEDYEDFEEYENEEDAKKSVVELKKNGEKAIIEKFSEKSRDPELSDEVDYYNKTFNEGTKITYSYILSLPGCVPCAYTSDWDVEDAKKEYLENEGANTNYTVDDIDVDYEEFTSILKEAEEINKAEEIDENPKEEPKNGLGTGYATFVRKPSNIEDLDNKAKYFTDGDASYLIVEQQNLSKDEFDKLQENFLTDNSYCKSFEPLDTDNYSYNVIEFNCPDYDYKLLVDPSGFSYCRYVAKI